MIQDTENSIRTLVHRTISKFRSIRISEENYNSLFGSVSIFPYLVTQEGVCLVESKEKNKETIYYVCPISSYMAITKRLTYLGQNLVELSIEYHDGASMKEAVVSREEILSKSGIKTLLSRGIAFNESRSDLLLSYLLRSEQQAPVEHVHSQLGWYQKDSNLIFRGYQSFGSDDSLVSHYRGPLDIKPCGEIKNWLDMVKQDVLPHTPLTFCLLLGFASPVLSLLYSKYDLGTLVFNLANDSSRGKTTTAMLAASVFSNPAVGRGCVQSFHGTQNFLTSLLSTTSGFATVFDEGATFNGDFSQLLYLITAGKEKGRLGKDGLMKETLSWNNIVITTAEFSVINDDSPNGLRTRCFCLTDDMTQSAAHADRLKTVISENYGLAGNLFIPWILAQSAADVEKDYLDCIKLLQDQLQQMNAQPSPFTSRIFSKLAIILQVADYVSQCFDMDIDTDRLLSFIIQLERKVLTDINPVQRALDIILAEISRSSSHYISDSNLNPENTVGKIEQKDDVKLIAILKPEFERICQRHKLQSKIFLKELKIKMLLDCESDRLSKRVRLNRNLPEQVCYVLKIKDPDVSASGHKILDF